MKSSSAVLAPIYIILLSLSTVLLIRESVFANHSLPSKIQSFLKDAFKVRFTPFHLSLLFSLVTGFSRLLLILYFFVSALISQSIVVRSSVSALPVLTSNVQFRI